VAPFLTDSAYSRDSLGFFAEISLPRSGFDHFIRSILELLILDGSYTVVNVTFFSCSVIFENRVKLAISSLVEPNFMRSDLTISMVIGIIKTNFSDCIQVLLLFGAYFYSLVEGVLFFTDRVCFNNRRYNRKNTLFNIG
jgi:hypothetical protein